MSELLTMQDLANGHLDVKALGEAANGDENTIVTTRTGNTYPSAERAIKTLFENGGLPAKPFATKALMEAGGLVNGDYAVVTEDSNPSNLGLWIKHAETGTFRKSKLSPLNHTDYEKFAEMLSKATNSNISVVTTNLITPSVTWTEGYFENGEIKNTVVGFTHSSFIPITPLTDYVVSNAGKEIGVWYTKDKTPISNIKGRLSSNTNEPIKSPANAAYIRINKHLSYYGFSLLQTSATGSFDARFLSPSIKDIFGNQVEYKLGTVNIVSLASEWTQGGYLANDGTVRTNVPVYSYSDYIPVKPNTAYRASKVANHTAVFYDSDKNYAGSAGDLVVGTGSTTGFDVMFKTKADTAFMRINTAPTYLNHSIYEVMTDSLKIISGSSTDSISHWQNKTIAWYGTSIPAAQPHQDNQDVYSYANLAVHDLGGRIINKAIGGVGITTKVSGGLSFTTAGGSYYVTDLINLFGTADEPDLVVFDYGVNDRAQFPDDFASIDLSSSAVIESRNPSEFIGAFNKVIDAMLTAKPDVKFCFITHYTDDHPTRGKDVNAKMNEMIEACASYWQAPVLRLSSKVGVRNRNGFNNIPSFMSDGVHPASGDGRLTQALRAACRDFLQSIA